MKKTLLLLLFLLATIGIVACDATTTLTTTSTTSTTSTTLSSLTTASEVSTTTSALPSTNTSSITTTTTTSTLTTTTGPTIPSLLDQIPEECQDITLNDGWIPVFCDEFETSMGASIVDPDKWIYDVGTGNWGWGNDEDQTYTYRDPDNIKVEDGTLKIIALRENFNGKEYTSARIKSKTNLSWTYGKFEMRAKLPSGAARGRRFG
ncbi:MAG: glycoside hydrolase family 16 protein [Bacillus subtilis]|nr:glycoside hydrolase family 16 protein [Bacillus subtilis]